MNIIAKTFSIIFQPLLSGLYCYLLLLTTTDYLQTYTQVGRLLFVGMVVLFTIIIPVAIIFLARKMGSISNLEITERKERTPIYLATITSSLVGNYLIFTILNEYIFSYFMIFAILSIAFITLVNLFWKISSHACGMGIICSFTLYLSLLFSYDYIYIFCLAVILSGCVIASRLLLEKHTQMQVLAGFVVGILPILYIMFI